MYVDILEEAGYRHALLGMSLSYYDHAEALESWWTDDKFEKAEKRARILAHRQGGHNKFLESIQVWIYIQASRDFWQEYDTYRVGMTKQSSSTMHTLDKRAVVQSDFEEGTSSFCVEAFNQALLEYKTEGDPNYKNITRLKKNLPEGWLQERVVNTNYKVLQNIVYQRDKHRLKQWEYFIIRLKTQLQHPYFLIQKD